METKHKGPMDPIAIVELATDINRVAASAVQTSTAHLQAKIERLEREKGELVDGVKLALNFSDRPYNSSDEEELCDTLKALLSRMEVGK